MPHGTGRWVLGVMATGPTTLTLTAAEPEDGEAIPATFPNGHNAFHMILMPLLTAGRVPAGYSSADRGGINMGGGCRTYAGWRGARSVPAGDMGVEAVTGGLNLEAVRVPRLKPAFRPDGNLDEWAGLEPAVSLSSPAYIFPVYRRFPGEHCADPWGGAGDFSARTWLGWDGAALCVAAEVRDNVHVNGQTGDQVWNGDAMQLGLVNAAGDQWNIGAALAAKGPAFYQLDGPSDALTKTAGYAVVRDEAAKVTRYELRLPLADIGVKPGEECSFYLIFSDDDNGKGWYRRLQYLPSKTKPFMRRLYPKFVLVE